MARKTADTDWGQEAIGLIRFFGDVISSRMPYPKLDRRATDKSSPAPSKKEHVSNPPVRNVAERPRKSGGKATKEASASPFEIPDAAKPMVIKKMSGDRSDASLEQQSVVPER